MEALRFDRLSKTLSIKKVEAPSNPGPNEVIIKVAYSGVCGTDIHVIDGHLPCKDVVTMGHEFSGTVTEIGCEVTHVKTGDKVVVDPNRGCHCCYSCISGNYHYCKKESIYNNVGFWSDGGFASYAKIRGEQVLTIPDAMSLEVAALSEPLSCISHGLDRLGAVAIGSQILILGAGIIGVLWSNTLHLLGHRRITVSEPSEGRRKVIEGLDLGIEALSPSQLQEKRDKNPSWGVDVVIDSSANAQAIEGAIELLLPGGTLLIFGVCQPSDRFAISPYLIYKNELTIKGILINPFSFTKSLGMLEAFKGQYLEFKKNGIQIFPLKDFETAFRSLRAGTISKAMFKLE